MTGTEIQTVSGRRVDIQNPSPDMICIEDIAHGLSHLCRFSGQTHEFYSVAQHSVFCYNLVLPSHYKLAALLHDASEAYMNDLISPLKNLLPGYKVLEHRMMTAISVRFGFYFPLPKVVLKVDKYLLEVEMARVATGVYKYNWTSEYAKERFLEVYHNIKK